MQGAFAQRPEPVVLVRCSEYMFGEIHLDFAAAASLGRIRILLRGSHKFGTLVSPRRTSITIRQVVARLWLHWLLP